jgi:hypothetical protein
VKYGVLLSYVKLTVTEKMVEIDVWNTLKSRLQKANKIIFARVKIILVPFLVTDSHVGGQ